MKITKLLLTPIIICALCLLSNYSGNTSMIESFDRITKDSTLAYSSFVYQSGSEKKPTPLDEMSVFISSYKFKTLNDAIKAYNDNVLVGVNVHLASLEKRDGGFFSRKLSEKSVWTCIAAEGYNVDCKTLDQGYPNSIVNVEVANNEITCKKSSCRTLDENKVVSKQITPSSLLTSKVVITVKNDNGQFSAESQPISQITPYPSTWIYPVRIRDIHSVIQRNQFYDSFPNIGKQVNSKIISVEDDLSELIRIEDKVKSANLGVAESFINSNLKAEIESVEGFSAVSIFNFSITMIGLIAPFIALGIMIMVVANLNKVDRRLTKSKTLPEDVTDSIIYGSERLSRICTITLLLFPAIMCILPPFLMPYEIFADSTGLLNLTIKEMLVSSEWFRLLPISSNSEPQSVTNVGLLLATTNTLIGCYCLHKIDKQRDTMEQQEENTGNNDVPVSHIAGYAYSVPNVTIDNLRI